MASQQTDYMQARLERLLADVDNIARTSLQRERHMGHSDPLPYLSRMQPGAAMSLGLSAGMGAAPHGPGAVPRVQDARETRARLLVLRVEAAVHLWLDRNPWEECSVVCAVCAEELIQDHEVV